MTQPDDEVDLLASYRQGDALAFHRLVDLYQARMVQFFHRRCLDRDRAEDLAQDLFLKLVRGIDGYRPEGRMSIFIFRVATNLWIDHYRHGRHRPRTKNGSQLQAASEDSPGQWEVAAEWEHPALDLARDEDLAAVRAAVAKLPEQLRHTLELAVYEARPYAEIGQLLGIPVGTVKSRVHHAVARLKDAFGVVRAGAPIRRACG